ncbi:hypothetical protein GCM10010528_07920 [Gordonia defluvii]|uniref:Uncharacterized protein n=1 Tax=Gordonia defluvii TaxID=283718 RepID=A0ABP6L4K9_9ACTN
MENDEGAATPTADWTVAEAVGAARTPATTHPAALSTTAVVLFTGLLSSISAILDSHFRMTYECDLNQGIRWENAVSPSTPGDPAATYRCQRPWIY